jgi:hypothetical protein
MHAARLTRASLAVLVLVHVAAPIYFWEGGLIETEATHFVRQYLDGRSLLQKVFDPHGNDIGTYQARELSYLFDAVDARVLERLLAQSTPLFVPFSALLASFLTTIVFFVGSSKVAPQLRPVMATLILLLYLSNHVYLVTTAVYYRSTKPLLAPVLLIALFYLTHVLRQAPHPAPTSPWVSGPFIVVCALGCTMSLLDRQGFFYAVIMLAGLTLWYRARGGRRDLLHGSIAAIALMMLYNFLLAPFIVKQVNGYWPSFEYQKLDALHLIGHPLHLVQALRLMAQGAQIVLGSFPGWVYAGVAVLLLLSSARHAREIALRDRFRQPGVRLVCLVVGSQILMFGLMIVRHPPIWDFHDHRLWYYPLPFQILVLFGVMLLIAAVAGRLRGASAVAVNAVLVAMIVGNILGWPAYRRVMLASKWLPGVHAQSALLKQSFEQQRPADDLTPDYRALYDFFRARRAGAAAR